MKYALALFVGVTVSFFSTKYYVTRDLVSQANSSYISGWVKGIENKIKLQKYLEENSNNYDPFTISCDIHFEIFEELKILESILDETYLKDKSKIYIDRLIKITNAEISEHYKAHPISKVCPEVSGIHHRVVMVRDYDASNKASH